MRAFRCEVCAQLVFLHDDRCLGCGAALRFRPSALQVVVAGPDDVRCSTAPASGCNWLVEDGRADGRCRACRCTELVPPLDDPDTAGAYATAERDHRWLRAQLLALGLDADRVTLRLPSSRHEQVVTGHADGVVTIDVEETDDARRMRERDRLGEDYRTFLGHLRHEFGHALFPSLVTDVLREEVRSVFGDERQDYDAALRRHYDDGPPDGWRTTHVSAYATMHPAEDWAETFAHLLHVTDTLESADAFGLRIDPAVVDPRGLDDRVEPDPARRGSTLRDTLAVWVPLSYALNAVTRAMGQGLLYPFVLSDPVVAKLELVDRCVRAAAER